MIEQADKLLEQNNVKAASALYLKATNILKDSPYAYVGLTRCAVLDKDVPSFEKYSNLAITNSKKESDAEKKRITTSMVSLKGNLYSNIADDYQQKGDRENAVFYYMRALKIDNTSVWNAYALSNLLLDKGDRYTALKTIDEVSPSVKNTSEYAFAHALILDKTGDTKKAFKVLSPYKHTSQSIDENIERFEQTLALEKANKLYASGDLNGAIEAIEKYKVPYIETTKAQYQYEAGDLNHAVVSAVA
jgi:tetratricopeptide (TPR) repeat protein